MNTYRLRASLSLDEEDYGVRISRGDLLILAQLTGKIPAFPLSHDLDPLEPGLFLAGIALLELRGPTFWLQSQRGTRELAAGNLLWGVAQLEDLWKQGRALAQALQEAGPQQLVRAQTLRLFLLGGHILGLEGTSIAYNLDRLVSQDFAEAVRCTTQLTTVDLVPRFLAHWLPPEVPHASPSARLSG